MFFEVDLAAPLTRILEEIEGEVRSLRDEYRQDGIHSNSLSPRCGECHSKWAFAPANFNHTTVGCNLTGLHRVLPCYDCHKAGNFGGLSPQCYACHRDTANKVATHAGRTACSNCHSVNSWATGTRVMNQGYGRESICR